MLEFQKSVSDTESLIEIKESKTLMKAFDVSIQHETHTLGHLLQSYINRVFKEKNIFVGYINPHPLENIDLPLVQSGIKYNSPCQ